MNHDGSVTFRFFRPEAADVKLAGDFTGWSNQAVPMSSAGDGWWTLQQTLGKGEYRFRYLADGKWFTDYASYGIEATKAGWNSVLVVPAA
jgi:1,4-alpha-glucan branching enzyme